MDFDDAIGARKKYHELHLLLKQSNYNSDLYKVLKNIDSMITELSKLEVQGRNSNRSNAISKQLENIKKSMDYLEKMLLILKLSE